MKVAILTCSTENRKWLYDITNPTKEKYCKEHGYTYIFSDTFYPDKTRHPYWNKIKFVAENLKNYDYVIWMDDDAGFIKFDKSFDEILKCDFGYCEDLNGFNCGVFVVKNTYENQNIFDFIWAKMYEHYKEHKYPEQDALLQIYQKDMNFLATKYDGKIYNAYDKNISISPINQRNEDTIILHIANGSYYKENNKEMIRRIYAVNM